MLSGLFLKKVLFTTVSALFWSVELPGSADEPTKGGKVLEKAPCRIGRGELEIPTWL